MASEPRELGPLTKAEIGHIWSWVLCREIRHLIAHGYLTETGLLHYEERLNTDTNFETTPHTEETWLQVIEALAALRGTDPADMPGWPQVPDDASGLGE